MRHTLQFFDSEVLRWKKLAVINSVNYGTADQREGLNAYAHRQADIRAAMRDICIQKWSGISHKLNLAGEFKDRETGLVEFQSAKR